MADVLDVYEVKVRPEASSGLLARLTARLGPWRHMISAVAVIAVLAVVWFAVEKLVAEVSYREVVAALHATPWRSVGLAVLFTVASFAALTVYDVAALYHVGRRLPYRVVAYTAFCAYAVGNTAGFGPLTGGTIRYRFYAPLGVEPEEIARIVGFVTLAFMLGLAGVTAIGLLIAADQVAGSLSLPPASVRAIGGLVLLGLALVPLTAAFGGRVGLGSLAVRLPSARIMAVQFAATVADVFAAAVVLWVLLPATDMSFFGFVAIYSVALGLGVLSHVPAGLGVFETVMVATVGRTMPADQLLSALVLYRLIYHVLPLLFASGFVTLVEVRRVAAGPRAGRFVSAGARLAPPVLGALTLVLGAMLVFSGVTPAFEENLDHLAGIVPLPLIESAHFLASVLGLGLLVTARGLAYRLDGAWWAAVIMAAAATAFSLLKAFAVGEALLLLGLLAALLATRREFSRPASLLHQALSPAWLAAIGTVLVTATAILFFVYKHVHYADDLWWEFEFSAEAPRSLRALIAVTLIAGSGAVALLLRPAPGRAAPADAQDLARAIEILNRQPHAEANLVRMGDKSVMFSEDGSAFIMYARHARSWIALFDPVGPREAWPELVWNFVETARAAGGRAVFYQVTPENLAVYADAGLAAFKLGEDARVDLAAFDLKGGKRYGLRQTLSRGDRDGLSFELLPPSEVDPVMGELRRISDAWLIHHKAREKRFSLGAFKPDFVRSQPVAVLRHEGRIVAFATVLTTDLKQEASVDLMRFDKAPSGAMEYLFLKLILHFKEQGYAWFNLGMAPLSGLSASPAAPIWHRVGRTVFEHAERFYNFRGLRAFKGKFQPQWRPRYLAISGGANPALVLADVTLLIGGGLKGVVGK